MIKDIRPVQDSLENKFNREVLQIDLKASAMYNKDTLGALSVITDYSYAMAQQSTERWKKLGEYLMVKYMDGNVKKEANGAFKRNPYGQPAYPDQPGYDARYYQNITRETGDKLKVTHTIHDKKK
jgi:hypothetical protein